jgi:hypothetical protein
MPFIPVPDVAQVDFTYNWHGQICQNVLHYKLDGGFSAGNLISLANDAITEWGAGPKIQMTSNISLISVKCTDLSTENGPTYTTTAGLPLAGTLTAPSVPNNVAMVVTKRTAQRGRSFRGRLYHPAIASADVTANVISAGRVAAVVAAWTTMLQLDLGATTVDMVVISRYTDNAPRVLGIWTLVDVLTADNTIDSMRSRLPGRGA